jgi:hypothetical protein
MMKSSPAISERRSVRDPQVAFITGDVDLHA